MDAYDWLRKAGITVERRVPPVGERLSTEPDAIVIISIDSSSALFAVEERQRAPYPNELARLEPRRNDLTCQGKPLLVVPFVPETLASALIESGWSWADSEGNFDLRAPGLLLKQRRTAVAPRTPARGLPRGSGSFAIIRALIRFGAAEEEEAPATALAAQAKVSQPRASQVLARLHELKLVERRSHGRWRPNREALLDRFLAEYGRPGGTERYFYSLDSLTEVAVRAGRLHNHRYPVVVSADVGPDLIVAWRRPTTLLLYAEGDVATSRLGVVAAQGSGDANVIVRHPDDRSVFPTPDFVAEVSGTDVYMADPTQMIWDLQDLGGEDRLEAAGRLREWLLTRH
jgi:DNA-binding transcriptional ArsR family regulator